MSMQQPRANLEIVLIDDNFSVRYVLTNFLQRFAKQANVSLDIHTSADGVQGLGYIFTAEPDIIIVDSTLPQYSGREIVEFLSSNQKYSTNNHFVIVIHEGHAPLNLPPQYTVLDKRDKNFLRNVLEHVGRVMGVKMGTQVESFHGRFLGIGHAVLRAANRGDRILHVIESGSIFAKLLYIPWIMTQISVSFGLTWFKLFMSQKADSNLKQYTADMQSFRVRHYPTVVTVFLALLLIVVQIAAYLAGGLALLRIADHVANTSASWGNGYSYRRTITVDHTKVDVSSATNFPMLVSGTYSYLATVANGGKVQNSNGYDIIFTSDSSGSSKLNHQVEKYDPTTGEIVMWISVSSLNRLTDATIYMFYGNSSISTTQENVTGTWNSNYKLVMHLNENTTSATGYKDSTSNANNSVSVTIDGTGSNTNATGKIGTAVQFDGSNDAISIADATSLDINSSFTLSAWFNVDTLPASLKTRAIVAKTGDITSSANNTDTNYSLSMDNGLSGSGQWQVVTLENISHVPKTAKYSSSATAGTWYYLTGVFDDSTDTLTLYQNGASVASTGGIGSTPFPNDKAVYIGVDNATALSSFSQYFDGFIDEVRLSNTVRTPNWISTEYNNQNSPSTFYSVGAEETSVDATVSSTGTQTAYIAASATNQYLGGTFVIQPSSATVTVTGITIAEQGTVDAVNGLDNIKLFYELDTAAPYDCAGESYAGTETQFGSTDTDGFSAANGTSAFTGSVAVTTSQAMCVYVVMDTTASASQNETIDVQITNPSTDVTLASSKTASPGTAVTLAGSTTVGAAPAVTVSTTGTQTSTLTISTSQYVGGAFTLVNSGNTINVTGISINEQGTVNAQSNLSNIKMYYEMDTSSPYDCSSESYSGSETQYGSTTSFNGSNGSASFTGSVSLSSTQAMCVYVVLDVPISAGNGETVEIQITDPSTQVTVSAGSVSPGTVVSISGTSTISNSATSLTLQVGATADNGFDVAGNGSLFTASPMYVGGKDVSGNLITAGLRFTNVTIPPGATINSAKLDFQEDWGGNYATYVKTRIYGEAADNAATYSVSSLPRSRTKTSSYVDWDSNGVVVAQGQWYSTSSTAPPPESAALVQEIVDRAGWASGNSLSMLVADDGSTNDWYWAVRSYSYSAAAAPKLYVTYTTTSVVASASGTQTATLNGSSTNQYVGGKFVLVPGNATAKFTSVKLAEQGTVDAQANLSNIKLYYDIDTTAPYDCASESYAGTESQYGSTATSFDAANGSATFTANLSVTTSQALCLYPVLSVGAGAANGDTIELQISNPSTDVGVLSGSVSPGTAVAISGTTTIYVNYSPTVTNVSVNGGSNITLNENSTAAVQVTATVTDANGYSDISSVTGRLYRSGVAGAQACTLDDNNCYQLTGYNLTGCAGNSCTATLDYSVKFFAEPTDSGSIYAAQYWLGWVQATDSQSATGTDFSPNSLTDMNTLLALGVQSTIDYGSLLPGDNTGAVNSTTVVTNTGNAAIDVELSGTDLCTDYPTCSAGVIPVGNQQYKSTTFTYGAGTALTSVGTLLTLNIGKPTTSPSGMTGNVYWGIGLPSGLVPGTYTGVNSFVAVAH